MIRIADAGAQRAVAVLALLVATAAPAARVADLYSASVPVADASAEATRDALTEALRRVVVKVTGRAAAAQDQAVMGRLGEPAALVQQFRRDGAGNLWAQFDAAAVRKALGGAGLPVWGEDRPATLVWLAYDAGGGEHDILAGGGDGQAAVALRHDLLAAAATRAVPLLLPLGDSQDLAAVSYTDVWGEYTDTILKASARYQADAVLIGRARLVPSGAPDVRWTLIAGDGREAWRGGVADGPQGVAEHLARSLASAGPPGSQPLRLGVTGVRSMDNYGQVLGYLKGLDVVESMNLAYVSGETLLFDLKVRGDSQVLTRALAVGRVLEPAAPGTAAPGVAPDLLYRLSAAP